MPSLDVPQKHARSSPGSSSSIELPPLAWHRQLGLLQADHRVLHLLLNRRAVRAHDARPPALQAAACDGLCAGRSSRSGRWLHALRAPVQPARTSTHEPQTSAAASPAALAAPLPAAAAPLLAAAPPPPAVAPPAPPATMCNQLGAWSGAVAACRQHPRVFCSVGWEQGGSSAALRGACSGLECCRGVQGAGKSCPSGPAAPPNEAPRPVPPDCSFDRHRLIILLTAAKGPQQQPGSYAGGSSGSGSGPAAPSGAGASNRGPGVAPVCWAVSAWGAAERPGAGPPFALPPTRLPRPPLPVAGRNASLSSCPTTRCAGARIPARLLPPPASTAPPPLARALARCSPARSLAHIRRHPPHLCIASGRWSRRRRRQRLRGARRRRRTRTSSSTSALWCV